MSSLEPHPPQNHQQHQQHQQQQQLLLLESIKTASAGCENTIGTVAESDMDESDWFDSCTNQHVIASSYQSMVQGDPWNHPLLNNNENDNEDDYFLEASKRVSLDATETWMTTTDDDNRDALTATDDIWLDPNLMLSPTGMNGPVLFSFALPSSISFPTDEEDDHDNTQQHHHHHHHEDGINLLELLTTTASLDDSSHTTDFGSETESWHSQFQQRRVQLAKSMAASQSTRSLLSQHVQTRASLQQVLLEIEKSTTQIQQHIVIESVGMAVESAVCVESDDLTSPINTTTRDLTTVQLDPNEKLDSAAAATTTAMLEKDHDKDDVEMEDVANAAAPLSKTNSKVTSQVASKPAPRSTLVQ